MLDTQRQALKLMTDRRFGAVPIDGRWIWPEDIRRNPETAAAVVHWFAEQSNKVFRSFSEQSNNG